jgi:hypothetical protein
VTALFNLTTFIWCRAQLGVLDVMLSGLMVTCILMTLLSLSAAGRPNYVLKTNLSCGVLSFLANICYFSAQYLQEAMFALTLLPGSFCGLCLGAQWAPRPTAGLAIIGSCAMCSSLFVVALLGTSGELHKATMCQVDPLNAWPEYELAKFGLGFGPALALELFLFLHVVQCTWRAAPAQRDAASARWVVLAVTLTMFVCRLSTTWHSSVVPR